jgi:hypothetical protein
VVPLEPVLLGPLDEAEGVPIEPLEPVELVEPVEPVEPLVLPLLLVDWEEVVSEFDDFLFLFMSPSARAEPLASATKELRMNAGASLRMWDSWDG